MPKQTGITHVTANLPTHMKDLDRKEYGLEGVGQFVIPPRIRVVHSMSDDSVTDMFGVGDVIAVPSMTMIAEMKRNNKGKPISNKGFNFTPLFFFVEWVTWRAIGSIDTPVADRSFDPRSELARKARSPRLREEKTNEGDVRHIEHLNFIVQLDDIDIEPIILSFARGEHTAGSKFCGLLKSRNAPIFGCVFHADLSERKNDKGSWWGMDIVNPVDASPWVTNEKSFSRFKTLHAGFKAAHQDNLIKPDYDSGSDDTDNGGKPNEY